MNTSALQDSVRKQIFTFLDPKEFKVFIFGSRATEKSREFSDVDIGIEGKNRVPSEVMEKIREAFENSAFPYFVDVVDFQTVSDKFRTVAKKHTIDLN